MEELLYIPDESESEESVVEVEEEIVEEFPGITFTCVGCLLSWQVCNMF